jgi:hypothetical protein
MRCKEIEQEIYLYDELTSSAKAKVDEHVTNCKDCSSLLKTIQDYQSVAAKMADIKPQPANHSRLTSNIMQAIQANPKQQLSLSIFLQRGFVKYSLMAASLALVILFISEQQAPARKVKFTTAGMVTLQSQSAVSIIKEQKEKKEVSLYACSRNEGCNNTFIEKLKQKNL